MLFELMDAGQSALPNEDFMAPLPYVPELDERAPLLDPSAHLPVFAAAAAASGELAALVQQQTDLDGLLAAFAEAAATEGALVGGYDGILVATVELPAFEPPETAPTSQGFDLSSADFYLPPQEDDFAESGVQNSTPPPPPPPGPGETVVVTGNRVRHYYVSEPAQEPILVGDTWVLEPIEVTAPNDPGDVGFHVYEIAALGIKIRISIEDWEGLSPSARNALFFILDNYDKSPHLALALQHLKNQDVTEIFIRRGSQGWNFDGSRYNFGNHQLAGVSSYSLNADGTDLAAGSAVVITFNSNHWGVGIGDVVGKGLIHELFHPYVPDAPTPSDPFGDHVIVEDLTNDAWRRIVPLGTILEPW